MPRLFGFWTMRRGFGLGLSAAVPPIAVALLLLLACLLVAGVEVGHLLQLLGVL